MSYILCAAPVLSALFLAHAILLGLEDMDSFGALCSGGIYEMSLANLSLLCVVTAAVLLCSLVVAADCSERACWSVAYLSRENSALIFLVT